MIINNLKHRMKKVFLLFFLLNTALFSQKYSISEHRALNDSVKLIEVHNRPNYIPLLKNLKKKLGLYFHNAPNTMLG